MFFLIIEIYFPPKRTKRRTEKICNSYKKIYWILKRIWTSDQSSSFCPCYSFQNIQTNCMNVFDTGPGMYCHLVIHVSLFRTSEITVQITLFGKKVTSPILICDISYLNWKEKFPLNILYHLFKTVISHLFNTYMW